MKNYHNVYLKFDALVLADVFEKAGDSSLKNYGLCPSNYLSTPSLTRDAMVNMTKVELELISVSDMYLFFKKGMRSGFSQISKKYNETNNKYWKSYEPKQEPKHIIYVDANNIYCFYFLVFPTSRFIWINAKEFDFNKYSNNSLKGGLLEIDLEYSKKLRELHKDYPSALDK